MSYFENFGKILYDPVGNNNPKLVTDIMSRVRMRANMKKEVVMMEQYDVQENETPEIVADKHHGSPYYHWVVMLLNDISDVNHDWVKSTRQLQKYLLSKYTEVQLAETHHYEIPQTSRFIDIGSLFGQTFDYFHYSSRLYDQSYRRNCLTPAADLYEDDAYFYARIELPGMNKKGIDVKLENSVLTISGNRKFIKNEREQSLSFSRSLSLPDGIQEDKIKVTSVNGILTIKLPKVDSSKPKLIEVK